MIMGSHQGQSLLVLSTIAFGSRLNKRDFFRMKVSKIRTAESEQKKELLHVVKLNNER